MKSVTCDICKVVVTGESEKDVMDKIMVHMEESHKDMAEKYKAMPKENQERLDEEVRKTIVDVQ